MAAAPWLSDSVLLLDNFSVDGKRLYDSFKAAGFSGKTVVIDDGGFLPSGVISAFRWFCGSFRNCKGSLGRPRYFNEVPVPEYWEIKGTATNGSIWDMNHERARIFYVATDNKRLVKDVDWQDEKGMVRYTDHYDRFGVNYARTIFNSKQQKFSKTWFDGNGKEVLMENYVTGSIILNRRGKIYVFKNRTELVMKLFEEAGIHHDRIFYNSLSYPFFISERYAAADGKKKDVLFWQERERSDIPGNMQIILNGNSHRAGKVLVQRKASYEKMISLGVSKDVLQPLGFVYNFNRKNAHRKEALICTNSDNIEKLKELVEALPELHFHIAAITEMSSKLMSFGNYANVSLYPGVKNSTMDDLRKKCDYYLDVNHEGEILSATEHAFMDDQLILGFRETSHNRDYIASQHIFPASSVGDLIAAIKECMADSAVLDRYLDEQKKFALAETAANYRAALV